MARLQKFVIYGMASAFLLLSFASYNYISVHGIPECTELCASFAPSN